MSCVKAQFYCRIGLYAVILSNDKDIQHWRHLFMLEEDKPRSVSKRNFSRVPNLPICKSCVCEYVRCMKNVLCFLYFGTDSLFNKLRVMV